jgi:aminocarboxymuconate-semialdehyde decarboxylase
VHAHCIVPDAAKLINHPLEAPALLWSNVGDRLAHMDKSGVDVEALSINPFWYRAERDAAEQLIKVQNETLVEFCAGYPDRFVGFATAALQFPDLAAQQVEHAVKKLGFRGVGVAGSVAGEELANPKFHPFWAKCEELGVLVFMHPLGTRELEPSGRLAGSGLLTNTIGNPLETTIALSHLIFEGTLDRFPGLKICAAHGGGFLPSYANRSDAVIKTFPDRVGPLPKKNPTEYLRNGQLYFDTIMFTGEAIAQEVVHVTPERLGEEEPRIPQQQGWPPGQILRQLPCARQQLVRRQDLGHEPELQCLVGIEGLARQKEIAAAVHAKQQRVDDVHAVDPSKAPSPPCAIGRSARRMAARCAGGSCRTESCPRRSMTSAPTTITVW